MKLVFTFLALTIGVFTNAQISDNSSGTTATGNGSVAMGTTTTASGSYSTAMGVFTTASGDFSVAMSYQSIAAGLASTAIGWGTMANATASTALGYSTITNGEYSTAMGWNTSADGKLSTAIGYETTASDYGSLVIGRYNLAGATVTNSATEFNTANTAFVIGNGSVGAGMMDPPILSDAFKVMFNGDAYVSNSLYIGGTAITSTAAELNLLAGVTVIGTGILSNVTEGSNTGARLSTSNAANHGDIGSNAVDLSYSNSSSTTRGATGSNSTAMGDGTTASGPFSTAMGTASIASGEKSIAIGNQYQTNATTPEYNNEAAGSRSFVIGNNNSTTGAKAFSIGTDNLSTGVSSIALGENNIASGNFSQAIGLFSESTAYSSFAIGNNAFADGYNTTAIGTANTADVNADPLNWSLNNRAFVIGNGYYDVASATLNRSDALTVLFDGTTTISGSVIAPAFIGDGSQLTNLPDGFDGDYTNLTNKPLIRDIVASNPVFLGDMVSAFGTEQVTNRATLDIVADSDGDLITGFKNIGSGDRFNISLDTNNEYAEVGSGGGYGLKLFSEGGNMIFEGDDMMSTPSFNFNGNITNTGTVTAANFIGDGSQLTNLPDGFDGDYTNLTNSPLTFNTSGTGGIQSTGAGSITPSGNLASGTLATALGNQTRATSAGVLAIGQWNAFDDTIDGAAADPSHQAFVIGNGNGNGRSNAFEVLYDGTTTIAGDVVINSDMRLKANIISLGSTLSKLLQIDGKTYTMKRDKNQKQKIGVLAQDIEKVFPELVSESKGIKSVNYQGLVPVLINSIKEQEEKIKRLEMLVEKLLEVKK
tara:strand:- start:123 stop:2585 length:2463 start_codon:yes stop_codon:yes gene_type:complete